MSKKLVDIGKETTAQLIFNKLGTSAGASTFAKVASFSMGNTFFVGAITGGERSVAALNYKGELIVLSNDSNTILKMNGKRSCWDTLTKTPSPINIQESCILVYDNPISEETEIHVIGGYDYKAKSHYKYNGTSWSVVSELPCDFCNGKAIVYNGEIHIFDSGSNHYGWDGKKWEKIDTLSFNVEGLTPIVFKDELYMIGDKIYCISDNSLSNSISSGYTAMPNPSVAVVNDELHVIGGAGTHLVYTTENGWENSTEIPDDKELCESSKNLVAIDGALWIVGYQAYYFDSNEWIAYDGSSDENNIAVMSLESAEDEIDLPKELLDVTKVNYDDNLHLFGTCENGYNHFILNNDKWEPLERTPFDTNITKIIESNNRLFAITINESIITVSEYNGIGWEISKFTHNLDKVSIINPFVIDYMGRPHVIFQDDNSNIRHIVLTGQYYYTYDIIKNNHFIDLTSVKVEGGMIHIYASSTTGTKEFCVGCAITDKRGLQIYLPKDHQILCNKDEIIPIVGIVEETKSGYKSTDDGIYTFTITIDNEPYYTIV